MIKITIKFFAVLGFFLTGSFDIQAQTQHCVSAKSDSSITWHKKLLFQLNHEYKIDPSDARMIKMTSSNSHIAFEQTEQSLVEKYGKIKADDIIQICSKNKTDSVYYVFTAMNQYHHLFTYNIFTGKLRRVENRGSIVLTGGENLKFFSSDENSNIYCTQKRQEEDWIKYFRFDKKAWTLTHFKNCRSINKKTECETF